MRIENQISFDFTGEQLAEAGLSLAVETAEKQIPGWKETCWSLFMEWLRRKPIRYEFRIEEFRKYVTDYGLIEMPSSLRAFGFVSKKAVKEKWVEFARNEKVSNPKAHAAFASVWRKK